MKSSPAPESPEAQLRSNLDRFDPKIQKLFRSVRTALRKRFPTANELGYDYGSHVVISYSATEHAIHAVLAITARTNGVQLYFTQGKKLPDPKKLLQGSAQVRFVWLESARQLAHPDIKAFIAGAIDLASIPLPSSGKGSLIIRPTAASKRSRGR